jgi:hypothetical protein
MNTTVEQNTDFTELDIEDPTLKALFQYCVPYAVRDSATVFGNPDKSKIDDSEFDHLTTWIISIQDLHWFRAELTDNDQKYLFGTFFDDKHLGLTSLYVITKRGIVRVVNGHEFSLKYRLSYDLVNGRRWFSPEFLIQSYRNMDILFYVPEAKIKSLERWVKTP